MYVNKNMKGMYINVHRGPKLNQFVILSTCDIMKNRQIIARTYHDKIVMSVPSLDYSGVAYSPNRKDGWHRITVRSKEELPLGAFMIDKDESNEDLVTVYFEDRILKEN